MKMKQHTVSEMMKKKFLQRHRCAAVALGVILSVAAVSCADESMTEGNNAAGKASEYKGSVTSTVHIASEAGMQLPDITRTLGSEGAATRGVVLNEKYMPLAEGSDLTARVFLVKVTEDAKKRLNGEEVMDPGKVKLATGELTWNTTATQNGGGVRLSSDKVVTLKWLDNRPVDILPGETWYICGVIGGGYNEAYNPENVGSSVKELARKIYNFYVDFNPRHSKTHNTIDDQGRIRVTVPFSTGWTKLTVKKKNDLQLSNWAYKAVGTLLRFHVKRNTGLVPAEAHNYTFASSQITATGGFMFCPQSLITSSQKDHEMGVNCELRPWNQSIDRNWYWEYETDQQPHFNNPTGDKTKEPAATYGNPEYEFRYTYDSQQLRPGRQNEAYEDVYVWGMPINAPTPHQTTFTAEKGSFMLGRKQPQGALYDYADEWCLASPKATGLGDEFKRIDFETTDGKAYTAELGVCRPRYVAKDKDGHLYTWANQLERVAISNSKTHAGDKGFHDNVSSHSTNKNGGYIEHYTLNGVGFKQRFSPERHALNAPDGYHVPNAEEWALVFPSFYSDVKHDWGKVLEDRFSWTGFHGAVQLKEAPGFYYECFTPMFEDTRTVIADGNSGARPREEYSDEHFRKSIPPFESWFATNKDLSEFYAIRFSDFENMHNCGNRYRCAYRWRLIDMGGRPDADDAKGARLVVQSRWIGNAPVSIADLKDERWWGKSSESAPLYNTDCYRVLPVDGKCNDDGFSCRYYTRTHWIFYEGGGTNPWEDNVNKTWIMRSFSNQWFTRNHWDNNRGNYPVRLIASLKVDEFGERAPRQLIHVNGLENALHRKHDDTVHDWTRERK